MSDMYMPKISQDISDRYFELFNDRNYFIPTLDEKSATMNFYEQAILWCIENNQPMQAYWKKHYPQEYNQYQQLIESGCLL